MFAVRSIAVISFSRISLTTDIKTYQDSNCILKFKALSEEHYRSASDTTEIQTKTEKLSRISNRSRRLAGLFSRLSLKAATDKQS